MLRCSLDWQRSLLSAAFNLVLYPPLQNSYHEWHHFGLAGFATSWDPLLANPWNTREKMNLALHTFDVKWG